MGCERLCLYFCVICIFLVPLLAHDSSGQAAHRIACAEAGVSVQNTCTQYCKTDGSSGDIAFDKSSDATFMIITSKGCPTHKFQNAIADNPNSACVQSSWSFKIPKVPVFRATPITGLTTILSALAIALDGVVLYGPATGPTGGDAGNQECDTFDYCAGHSDPTGSYHYHLNPYCLELAAPKPSSNGHSPLIGWAPDGFPIYGLYTDDGSPPTDLDACQGHSNDSVTGYHYHMKGPTGPFPQDPPVTGFPYFPPCFKGCVSDEMARRLKLNGYTYTSCLSSSSSAPASTIYAGSWTPPTIDYSNINFTESNSTGGGGAGGRTCFVTCLTTYLGSLGTCIFSKLLSPLDLAACVVTAVATFVQCIFASIQSLCFIDLGPPGGGGGPPGPGPPR